MCVRSGRRKRARRWAKSRSSSPGYPRPSPPLGGRSLFFPSHASLRSRADAASDFGNRLVSLNDGGAGHDWARAVGGSHKRGEESLKQAAWIDRELVVPLKKWESETKGVAEELGRRARELQDKYDEHARTIAEARASHHAMADKGEKALREFEWAEKNKLLDAKERRRIESAHATLGPMVVEAEAKHDGAVKEGNAFLKQYVEHMTGILKGYEALERNRLIMSYRTLEEYRKVCECARDQGGGSRQ